MNYLKIMSQRSLNTSFFVSDFQLQQLVAEAGLNWQH